MDSVTHIVLGAVIGEIVAGRELGEIPTPAEFAKMRADGK